MSRAFSIYGLGLQPNVAIAGLQGLGDPGGTDVRLTLGELPDASGWTEFFVAPEYEHGKAAVRVSRSTDAAYHRLQYADGTTIVLESEGRAMWAVGHEHADVEDTATYLLGPVLGYLLRLRGVTSLHASAVVIDDRAVVFVGPSEAGKSSLAAAFARRGLPVLADDVVALEARGPVFLAQPAYPRVRLWEDSARSLFGDEDLPRITPSWEKRYLDLNQPGMTFARESVEVGAVYLLGERVPGADEARIERVPPREALVALVAETCAARLLDRRMRQREFDLLGRLVEQVPVRRLSAPESLARLDDTCARVEHDFRAGHCID